MIPLIDLVAQYKSIQPDIDSAIQRVLASGQFILDQEVTSLEAEIAAYLGVHQAVGLASGTDALILGLRALEIGPGDEVILPAYSFFATASAILHVGATPVFVDIHPHTYCLDPDQIPLRITANTKAIIPVHLYGHPADMQPLLDIAHAHQLKVIEDNAQALGAVYRHQKTGSLGDLACLSFFPSKNLGGYGDGGMLVTNHEHIANTVRMLRTHGWEKKYHPQLLGYNSRLDALQAAILRAKLPHLDGWNQRRRAVAECYHHSFRRLPGLTPPIAAPDVQHVYHLYILRCEARAQVQEHLRQAGIASAVYYPQPLHLCQPCRSLGYQPGDFPHAEQASQQTLAIPLYPEMSQAQVETVIGQIT
jgi:dTDP-4-amino-4,6-dideoxygalactose transaminase